MTGKTKIGIYYRNRRQEITAVHYMPSVTHLTVVRMHRLSLADAPHHEQRPSKTRCLMRRRHQICRLFAQLSDRPITTINSTLSRP